MVVAREDAQDGHGDGVRCPIAYVGDGGGGAVVVVGARRARTGGSSMQRGAEEEKFVGAEEKRTKEDPSGFNQSSGRQVMM